MSREAHPFFPPDILVSIAREHLRAMEGAHIAPNIPPRKLHGARQAHGLASRPDEPVVVLYDATLFGSSEDGFIVTPSLLYWKSFLEHPRSLPWDQLPHIPLGVEGTDLLIGSSRVQMPWPADGASRTRTFLEACGQRMKVTAMPYRESGRMRSPETFAEIIIAEARRALCDLAWVYFAPSIPPKMQKSARIVHQKHLLPDERILVLYDDTVLGSGNDGLLLTDRRVCWRNFWSTAEACAWTELSPDRVVVSRDLLSVDGDLSAASARYIDLRMRPGNADKVARLLREVARVAHGTLHRTESR